jgi:hypothetical protein
MPCLFCVNWFFGKGYRSNKNQKANLPLLFFYLRSIKDLDDRYIDDLIGYEKVSSWFLDG